MLRVLPAPEPSDFDQKVRQPGQRAIREMTGQQQGPRRGRPRSAANMYARPEDIPAREYPPFWTGALADLLRSYKRLCHYTSLYIEPITGAATIDHMVPKSKSWDRVYEWTNYRLACLWVNIRKDIEEVLDPFEVQDEWFELDLVGFEVCAAPTLEPSTKAKVEDTIKRLGLSDPDCCMLRAEYAEAYQSGEISLAYLQKRAPFVAKELLRQKKQSTETTIIKTGG